MMADGTYLLDSDVFMAAKNLYYSFDICPGYSPTKVANLSCD